MSLVADSAVIKPASGAVHLWLSKPYTCVAICWLVYVMNNLPAGLRFLKVAKTS